MSVKHTADYLDAPISSIYEWIKTGEIPQATIVRLGGRIFVNREALDTYLERSQSNSELLPDKVKRIYNCVKSNPAFHARKG